MLTRMPLPRQQFRRTPWKNGGGVTINIAGDYGSGAGAAGWAGTVWRFGRTAITVPAPFSDLTGYERMQLVIEGSGLVLVAPDREIELRTALKPVRYDGGTPLVSHLESGPVEVVNLIADRSLCAIDLVVIEAGARQRLDAGVHILYALRMDVSGADGTASFAVASGDALRFDAAAGFTLEIAAGLAVLASICPT